MERKLNAHNFPFAIIKRWIPCQHKKAAFAFALKQWKILWFLKSFLKWISSCNEFLISKRAQNEINFWLLLPVGALGSVSLCVFVSFLYLIFHLKWHKIYHLNTWWLNKKDTNLRAEMFICSVINWTDNA